MDSYTQTNHPDSLVVSATGLCLSGTAAALPDFWREACESEPDVRPCLRQAKNFKFMGKQDRLAVIAVGRALAALTTPLEDLRYQTALNLVVGYIPFERPDIEVLAEHSVEHGKFSAARFGREAIHQVNPLLTFRCLPNMPAFHVSLNFQMLGPYRVTYPDIVQWYSALEHARLMLTQAQVQAVVLGAVADQDNFLVEQLYRRLRGSSSEPRVDLASVWIVETAARAKQAGRSIRFQLADCVSAYTAPARPTDYGRQTEEFYFNAERIPVNVELGAASVTAVLSRLSTMGKAGTLEHRVDTASGFKARSSWFIP